MKSAASNINDLPEVVIRFFQKTASVNDLEELHRWLEDKEHQRLFDENQDVWLSTGNLKDSDTYNADQAWNRLFPEIESDRDDDLTEKKLPWKRILQIAAMILIAFTSGIYFLKLYTQKVHSTVTSFTEHSVPYGSRSMVTLPDGTKIWINAGSKIVYDQNFNLSSRDITLEGEAYFDVKANHDIPFMVHASNMIVKVVGTAFNIKAYPEENVIEATVERGQVYLTCKNDHITLNPKQKAIFYKLSDEKLSGIKNKDSVPSVSANNERHTTIFKETAPVIENDVKTELSTSWKDKRWIIEREELGSFAVKIGRRYNVTISFAEENLKHFVFSGALENESLEQVLQIIRYTSPVSYTINKKEVLLKEDTSTKRYPKPVR